MEQTKSFYNSLSFIVSFLFMCIIISATVGKQFLSKFLLIVLTSQILINANDSIKLFQKISVKNPTEQGVNIWII